MVREKMIPQGQGQVREFYLESGKIDILKKSQRKLKKITVNKFSFLLTL